MVCGAELLMLLAPEGASPTTDADDGGVAAGPTGTDCDRRTDRGWLTPLKNKTNISETTEKTKISFPLSLFDDYHCSWVPHCNFLG